MNGIEWIVDAHGCAPALLRDLDVARALVARIIQDLELRVAGEAQWHQFPPPGGVTGLCLLTESHLTIHTFPEFASLCLNLFCCAPRRDWDFEAACVQAFRAEAVTVRRVTRCYVAPDPPLAGTGSRTVGSRQE